MIAVRLSVRSQVVPRHVVASSSVSVNPTELRLVSKLAGLWLEILVLLVQLVRLVHLDYPLADLKKIKKKVNNKIKETKNGKNKF